MDQLIAQRGIGIWRPIDPRQLVVDGGIRDLCAENKCGNYGRHYMCPPHIGSLASIHKRLRSFQRGVVLQWSKDMDVRRDRSSVAASMRVFHHKILKLEGDFSAAGLGAAWGTIGGECRLCVPCKAACGEPCPYPDRARPSLESLGVDVLALLADLGLDNRFHPDRITWTGSLLYTPLPR